MKTKKCVGGWVGGKLSIYEGLGSKSEREIKSKPEREREIK
jgi:hypothetical protein